MGIEAAEMTTLARSRKGCRAEGPAGRPVQPAPRVRSSRGPATRGSLGGPSCMVAYPGFRFTQRFKSVVSAALVVLFFVVAAPEIASLNQPDSTPTPTTGDPAWTHAMGR